MALYVDNDNTVWLEGVEDGTGALADADFSGASGTVNLYSDAALSTTVTNASSLTLSYVEKASDGTHTYKANIPANADLTVGNPYWRKVDLTISGATFSETTQEFAYTRDGD